ncbi:hypothetical protein KCU71_g18410, partial [Aureobasidium melanogenum]
KCRERRSATGSAAVSAAATTVIDPYIPTASSALGTSTSSLAVGATPTTSAAATSTAPTASTAATFTAPTASAAATFTAPTAFATAATSTTPTTAAAAATTLATPTAAAAAALPIEREGHRVGFTPALVPSPPSPPAGLV